MIYHYNKGRLKDFRTASCLHDLLHLTAKAGDTLFHINLSTHHLHFQDNFIPSDFDYVSIQSFPLHLLRLLQKAQLLPK